MLESLKNSQLEYTKLSPEEMTQRGILGRLVGVCADFITPTRNGRKYGQELWEKVFNDPIMQERIENGVCFGELNHPFDGREETDIQKAAVCLAEVPKKGKDGKLRAVFDILSTPAGKILKTLCDYGSTLGVSSRGSGDLITDYDGNEAVDPSTYTCEGFDIVTIPAVKEARLQYVTESLNTKAKVSLEESLNKLINEASDSDRAIMTETLNNIGIELNEATDKYAELRAAAKQALNDEYGEINNGKDLEAALKVAAVDKQDKDAVKKIAHLLKTYDSDFVKVHPIINKMAELDIKTNADDIADMPLPDMSSFDDTPPTTAELNDTNSATTEESQINEPAQQEDSVEKSEVDSNPASEQKTEDLNNCEKNIVYNNIDNESINSQQQPLKAGMADDIDEKLIVEEVDNNKSDMINALQEALLSKQVIEAELLKLNEKLSVCYAKEAKQDEVITQLREALKVANSNQSTTKSLTESLKEKSSKQVALLNEANGQIRNLNTKCQTIVEKYNTLAENYNNKQTEIKQLTEDINSNKQQIASLQENNRILSEDLAKVKEESQQQLESYSSKIEKYKAVANSAVNKYIESLALKLDITTNEIKNRLPANYSFKDIDSVCESLSAAKVSMNMLPFRNPAKLRENMKLEIKGQKEPILKESYNVDDEVDDSLKTLAGM